ncbi:MAG: 4'-phosphopantetheinyl transferase superfamily protein [Proteobacteria bacterium]|nr:4'-phosphopantetheinyl transferase superfamily protein [Pseudomonadota bacterium]
MFSRIALSRLLLKNQRDPRESLKLCFPNKNFSISHKKNFSVALYLRGDNFQGCGVDIEVPKKIPIKHWHFFMTPEEILKLNKKSNLKSSYRVSRIWTIKEALLKSDMNNLGKFLKDYPLEDLMKAQGSFRIKNKKYKYFCFKKRAHYLAMAYSR